MYVITQPCTDDMDYYNMFLNTANNSVYST